MSLQLIISIFALVVALVYAGVLLRRPLPQPFPPRRGRKRATKAKPAAETATQWEMNLKEILRTVPKGRVVTFADLAERIGLGLTVLTVSRQVRSYEAQKKVPWWRAVRREGQRGMVPDSPLGEKQRALLEKEGVIFQGVFFRFPDYQWRPEPADKEK